MSKLTIRTVTMPLAAALTAAALAFAPAAAFAGDLAQVVSSNEEVAAPGTAATIDHGHVDLGLLLSEGQAEFLARDDSAETPVWRQPEDVVFQVGDNALLTLPEDKAFSFVGAEPGSQVWVVPQTEQADVPWLGWNTQAPSLADNVERGVTMEFLGHQGPGEFSLFLQNGGFEEPQLLWSTATGDSEGFWVDLGTHTHANWVFTEPGIHQIRVRMSGEGAGESAGKEVAAEATLAFAVGDDADVAQAQAVEWDPNAESSATSGSMSASVPTWIWVLAGVGVLVLIGAIIAVVRAKGGRRG
ncbi:choice-of-anchor M domain-containing protein [Corynebacterium aurimucosum]|uniref:choice-of-anchor M domain-containing protein n=1 Tax=Corynebacterium aurimucosum TaxID=169292 RepID=UPI0018793497|nr:choice-of-anchor M domain-containing protein [Corynebacterium aurimucosum]MBE7339645.1 choice-of-anchor M domain-containing protein [Corynebacterium aurimucosum]